MADPVKEFYLRFDDPKFYGHSKYRASEGWIDVVEQKVLWEPSQQLLRKGDPAIRGYFYIVTKDPVISALVQVAGGQKKLADAQLSCIQVSPRNKDKNELYRWIMQEVYIGDAQPIDKQTLGFYIHCRKPIFSNPKISLTAVLIGLLVPAVQK